MQLIISPRGGLESYPFIFTPTRGDPEVKGPVSKLSRSDMSSSLVIDGGCAALGTL